MQRNFEPMRKQVEAWQRSELTDATAKVVIYEAFVEGQLEAPKHLARTVHDLYFEPKWYRNSVRERSGVSPTRSPRRSRNWIPFHSSRRQPSWVNFWNYDSPSHFDLLESAGPTLPLNCGCTFASSCSNN